MLTADNQARCKSSLYLEYASEPSDFNKRERSSQQLYAQGEKDFSAARYGKAFKSYSTSNVWLPSYKAMIKAGDSIFYMHASGKDPEGRDYDPNGCSTEFIRATELHLPQTYDAALLFYDFEKERTGLEVAKKELDGVRAKSTCLKALASKYSPQPAACVDRHLIMNCLTPVGY